MPYVLFEAPGIVPCEILINASKRVTKKLLIVILSCGCILLECFSVGASWIGGQQAGCTRGVVLQPQRAYLLGEIPTGARIKGVTESSARPRRARVGRQAVNAAAPGADLAATLGATPGL